MTTDAITVVATGASSGIGFEAIKQLLLQQSQPYRIILGARNVQPAQSAYGSLDYDRQANDVTVLPLELCDLRDVRSFAQRALEKLGRDDRIDYLLLNAGTHGAAAEPALQPARWCKSYVVNYLSQHYLTHLLREKLVTSHTRIVVVSSGAIRMAPHDLSILESSLQAGADTQPMHVYCMTKFIQLLSAHWWRRQLAGSCDVLAVSPGLVPSSGLFRGYEDRLPDLSSSPDAISVPKGAENILRAFSKSDFPEDKDLIFLTSWGEWWSKDFIGRTCDKDLQDKWCPSKEEIEKVS